MWHKPQIISEVSRHYICTQIDEAVEAFTNWRTGQYKHTNLRSDDKHIETIHSDKDTVDKLQQLFELFKQEAISKEEFDLLKTSIIKTK